MNVSKNRLSHRFPGKLALINKLCSEVHFHFKFPTRSLENICDWLIEKATPKEAEVFWDSFEATMSAEESDVVDCFFQDISRRFGELQPESVQ